jgi:P-loop Domain of unknown function (DUF2791)
MSPEEWVAVIGNEYLAAYVPQGGAAVKFAAASTATVRAEVRERLVAVAGAHNFEVAQLDATEVRLHLADRLFHAVAAQMDWNSLTRGCLERVLRARGLRLPQPSEPLTTTRLAELNAAPEPLLRTELRRALEHELFEDYAMSREFRLAILALCWAHLEPTDNPALERSVKAWLVGELRLVSEVKRALIFQKVNRHNARHMLFSLAHWLTLAGKAGLVVILDVARYAEAVRPAERGAGNYYTTSATMDLYELLRELIDATDEARACCVSVLVGPDFLQDERRGVRSYQALYFRIWDEVYDRNRENPFSSLMRIAAAA